MLKIIILLGMLFVAVIWIDRAATAGYEGERMQHAAKLERQLRAESDARGDALAAEAALHATEVEAARGRIAKVKRASQNATERVRELEAAVRTARANAEAARERGDEATAKRLEAEVALREARECREHDWLPLPPSS